MKRLLMLSIAVAAFAAPAFLHPQRAFASTQIFLTSGSSWTVPSDWNNASNTVEAIGGGGSNASAGAGGGAYAKKSNVSLTPGGSASYQIGNIASNNADTWFSSTGTVLAKGGSGSTGGASGSSVGGLKYSGGNGNGTKGGGAAGPNGIGGNGGTGGTFGFGGGDGDAGYGGLGADGAANGANGTEWDATHGSGGAGGASASFGGGSGGNYGAGGALNFGDSPGSGVSAPGLIVITYDPAPPTCTLSVSHPTVPHGATIALNWTTTGATSASIDNSIGSVDTGTSSTTTMPTTTTTYTMSVSGGGGSDDCTATVTVDDDKIVFLTSGTSWTVPDDWNNASNTVEAIGGGGSGETVGALTGAGGGEYRKLADYSATPGDSISVTIGQGGVPFTPGTDTNFGSALIAKHGANGEDGGAGGSGGTGGSGHNGGSGVGGGGGGAGGPAAAGVSSDGSGDDGAAGDGGAGGAGGCNPGCNGDNGTEWDALHGAGGGGGSSAESGGTGGLYGGGGGQGGSDSGNGGNGAQGLIVITYTPAPVSCTLTGTPSTIAQGATAGLAWTTTSATSASLDNGIGSVSTGTGSATTTATTTTTYTMTVSGPSGSDTCSATVTFDDDKIVFLTSGTSWTVPDDWNDASNTIEAIGAGLAQNAGSSGGGAYAKKNNLTLTPGAGITYQIGDPSNDTDTWFDDESILLAAGPIQDGLSDGTGGQASDSVGDVKYSGGDSSGGAAGPNGPGNDGSGNDGGAGDAGYGGAGGLYSGVTQTERNGDNGTEWDALHGAGGGGAYGDPSGGCGGLYGGGGSPSPEGQGCSGAPGLIVITYSPITTPGTPGTPTFSNTTATSTTVSWSAAAGADTYKLERCTGAGCSSYSEIASAVSGTSYDDTGTLTGNTVYGYRVRGTNTYGDGSYSSGAEMTTLPDRTTIQPLSALTTTSVTVNWLAPTGGADTYKVERCVSPGCSAFTQIASGIATTSYNDTGLTPNTVYRYRVRATNVVGDGLYSGTVQVTTPRPDATCTLTADPPGIVTGGSSTLSWTTANAGSASIDNGIGGVSTAGGSTSVTPSTTTTYTLTVIGMVGGGNGSCTTTVSTSHSNATLFGGHLIINGTHIYIR